MLVVFLFLLLSTTYGIDFSDSSESCEDGGRGGHNHGRPPRPPGNGGGGRVCDAGWKFFSRPSGGWCIRVFAGRLGRDSANQACATQGGVLSGMQNVEEINYIVSQSLSVISPARSGGVWVGARRRPACISSGITATCTKTNSFYWTDNSATGINGMLFTNGEPNNGGVKLDQDCALLTVASTPVVFNKFRTGQMDDVPCTWQDPTPTADKANKGYVCGKKARR
ncbi:C-type lectin domain-containing protein [Caenorhabditis elegans]|uniref:C-type lectin domain-containing protein n=1 Tax=Caenorhabditis elegans TaxID=6239 RepID=O76400_CAEEL|nr:C-type lectin domain-containing protein [Caenorhabditis elegans]CCD69872.1 C-type lectin domain-containing protein [Caenorhabditis elegans]|eukprot:NP_503568.1 C-type LECtin [Caenorhabditis elegans]